MHEAKPVERIVDVARLLQLETAVERPLGCIDFAEVTNGRWFVGMRRIELKLAPALIEARERFFPSRVRSLQIVDAPARSRVEQIVLWSTISSPLVSRRRAPLPDDDFDRAVIVGYERSKREPGARNYLWRQLELVQTIPSPGSIVRVRNLPCVLQMSEPKTIVSRAGGGEEHHERCTFDERQVLVPAVPESDVVDERGALVGRGPRVFDK